MAKGHFRTDKDKVTMMLIPHNSGKTYTFDFSGKIAVFLGFLWLATVGVATYILTQHTGYELTKRANIRLVEKNSYFVQELAKTHEAFQRVAKVEEELRAMLKMKNTNSLLEYTGSGGPSIADQAQLMQTLSSRPTLTQAEFDNTLGFLRDSARLRMQSYNDLKKYVTAQRSLLASKPTTWPVRGWITSRFGSRISPFFEGTTFHQGLDIANEPGTSIKTAADGIVVFSGWQGGYGKLVVIDHGYGFSTRYAHLDRALVNIGQRIKRGQVIAFLGNTGRSTAPHLHFEVRLNGIPVDPMKYLK